MGPGFTRRAQVPTICESCDCTDHICRGVHVIRSDVQIAASREIGTPTARAGPYQARISAASALKARANDCPVLSNRRFW
jgi:hypothetical protein